MLAEGKKTCNLLSLAALVIVRMRVDMLHHLWTSEQAGRALNFEWRFYVTADTERLRMMMRCKAKHAVHEEKKEGGGRKQITPASWRNRRGERSVEVAGDEASIWATLKRACSTMCDKIICSSDNSRRFSLPWRAGKCVAIEAPVRNDGRANFHDAWHSNCPCGLHNYWCPFLTWRIGRWICLLMTEGYTQRNILFSPRR